MKFLPSLFSAALLGATLLATAPAAQAQVNININPPSWGPAVPQGAQYYYIPETNGFYDVPARQYVVSRNGKWIRTATLTGYNPSYFHPVVVDYVGAQPWVRYEEYKVKYPKHVKAPKKGYVVVPAGGAYYVDEHGGKKDKHEKHEGKHEGKGKGKGKH